MNERNHLMSAQDREFDLVVLLMVRNEELSLDACLSSLLKQSKSCKILVSDNHSSDASGRILQTYVEKYTNIFLVRPNRQLEQFEHAKFIKDESLRIFPDIPYRMILGADDEFTDPFLVEYLLTHIEIKQEFERLNNSDQEWIICPKLYLRNIADPAKSFYLENNSHLSKENYNLRLILFVLTPTSRGYYNFVLGLMSKELMSSFIDDYYRIASVEKKGAGRPIYSEYFATLRLLEKSKIEFLSESVEIKRIHNREGSYERIKFPTGSGDRKFYLTLSRQIQHSLTFLRAVVFSRPWLTTRRFIFYYFLGILAFFSNVSDPVQRRVKAFQSTEIQEV